MAKTIRNFKKCKFIEKIKQNFKSLISNNICTMQYIIQMFDYAVCMESA